MSDLAQDCLDILDALEIERTNVFEISIAGLIVQHLLTHSRDQHLTATIVTSSIDDASLQYCLGSDIPLDPPKPTDDEVALLAEALETDTLYEGPTFPIPMAQRAESVRRRYDLSYHPDGQARQLAAIKRFSFVSDSLAAVHIPTRVANGDHDVTFPPVQAEKIAQATPYSNFLLFPGMVHEICDNLGGLISDHVETRIQASYVEGAHVATHT